MLGWIPLLGWAVPAALLWAALALALALLTRGPGWVFALLVATGVPVLGLVTHEFGPIWGLAALGLGALGLGLVSLRIIHPGAKPRDEGLAPPDGPN